MTKWEYKRLRVERNGERRDTGWTYGPWKIVESTLPWYEALQGLGREGWELVCALPTDFWSEGAGAGNTSAGVRTIYYELLFKRPVTEGG
jgi:hypothetical protein